MKVLSSLLVLFSLVFGFSSRLTAADIGTLTPNLKVLERLLGDWDSKAKDDTSGVKMTRWSWKVGSGGHSVVGTVAGETGVSQLFYFDTETRKIVCITVGSDGEVSKNVYSPESIRESESASPNYFVTAKGQQGIAVEQIKWKGHSEFAWQLVDVSIDGVKKPNSPVMVFTRAK